MSTISEEKNARESSSLSDSTQPKSQQVQVGLGQRSYCIEIGAGRLRDCLVDDLKSHLSGEHVVLVTDDVVAPLYLDPVSYTHLTLPTICSV